MKVIFDLRKTGLGNNGGSSTLIKSGNALVDLGVDVVFADGGKNQHTWTKLKAEHIIVKNNKLPKADFIIATGYKSVATTVKSPDSAGIKCHYLRGWETWQGSEQWIVNTILKAPTVKFVNGLCLQDKLKQYNHKSYLVRPGYDFGELFPKNVRKNNEKIVIGGLNKQGKHVNTKRTMWILDSIKELKKKYGKNKIELLMFGMDAKPNGVDNYIKNPSMDVKNNLYNYCDIWLAPTMLEGLHMPPAEAMMTECPVVGTNAEMNGMKDYLIDKKTGFVSENNFKSFLSCIDKLVSDKEIRLLYGVNARKRVLEIGDRKENMNKFIKLLKRLKNDL